MTRRAAESVTLFLAVATGLTCLVLRAWPMRVAAVFPDFYA